jgi:hypothetical protein
VILIFSKLIMLRKHHSTPRKYQNEKHAANRRAFHIPASIPESYELYNAEAGILTCSPLVLPSRPDNWNSDILNGQWLIELTAAGQLRIYTVFPFNPVVHEYTTRNQSAANVTQVLLYANNHFG